MVRLIVLGCILTHHFWPPVSPPTKEWQARLVFFDTTEPCPIPNDLDRCRNLTVSKYSNNGIQVLRRSEKELQTWLESDGRVFAKALRDFQYVAYARDLKADAIGGVSYYVPDPEPPNVSEEYGPQIYGWCINLRTCERPMGIPLLRPYKATKRAARSLTPWPRPFHPARQEEWTIATNIEPSRRWRSGVSRIVGFRGMIGVQFEKGTNLISLVLEDSPAQKLGIVVGDRITSLDGVPVAKIADPCHLMESVVEGQSIQVDWEHGDKRLSETTTVMNYFDYEFKKREALLNKEVPDLRATTIIGDAIHLHQFKGKIVVLSFWATPCGSGESHPLCLQMMADELKNKPVVWINVCMDENDKAWRRFVAENRLNGIQLRSPEWARAFSVNNHPKTYIIDGMLKLRGEAYEESVASVALGMALDAARNAKPRDDE